jgi:hypothetical protein
MAALRFLADESCDFAVVRALRGAGYDVVAVAEFINQSGHQVCLGKAHTPRTLREHLSPPA